MTLPLTRLKGTKPVSWTTILGIVLVPLTVAGILLWGLWNPTERLENVTAAVVNNDKPVEMDGQMVPLGRVLAGELIGGDADNNFTWQLTDDDDAKKGIKDGRYATVITIPENFSAAATSLSDGPEKAKTAYIDIAEGEQSKLIDTALSSIVTQTATSVLNKQLGAQFVGGVFVGMNELHKGIGEAADGATQLADGGTQLSEGADQLADGTTQLSEGAQQLSSGVSELSTGAQQLSGGVSGLSTGAQQLSSGVAGLSAGAGSLATGVSEYTAGATTLSETYAPLAVGADGAVTQLKTIIGAMGKLKTDSAVPQQQLTDGLTDVGTGVAALGTDIATLHTECLGSGATQTFCDGMRDTIGARAGEIGVGLGSASTGATGLGTAMGSLETALTDPSADPNVDPITQLDLLSGGLKAFGTGLSNFATQGTALSTGATELATGTTQLSTGASELATGTTQLSTGASELAAGTTQLSTGAAALAEGTPDLADGATQLADGVTKSADGASDLAKGLDEAAAGIPNYTEKQRETLSEKAVTPVEMRGGSDEIFTSSGAPLFAGIALWAGALASFLVLAPLWRRTRDAARGVGYITMRSALPALAIGAVQGAIAGVILPAALGYDLSQATGFFGFALLAGIAFALVVQGLSSLLGGLGRFIAFALLVVAFAVGVVSTVPGPLAVIGDLSPVGSALSGFQAIASGAAGAGGSAMVLVVWAGLGLILTALAIGRVRRAKQ